MSPEDRIIGSILGTAVGDALGLPCEGLSKHRQQAIFERVERMRFLFGRGMVSDDTEHTCMVAQALLASQGDEAGFARSLAWRLRFWLLGIPAGAGRATLRAILKLWVGFPPHRSGVFSAGNGPAMRCAVLGACFSGDDAALGRFVRATTRITHTDPKAEMGAMAVAVAAQLASQGIGGVGEACTYMQRLTDALRDHDADEFLLRMGRVVESIDGGESTQSFAEGSGLSRGVSGYVYHTVPVAIHAWLSHPGDYRAAVEDIVACGGDTDTTAAIVGGIVGAGVGKQGIPAEWLATVCEWPRTVAWMEELGRRLAALRQGDVSVRPVRLPVWGLAVRNVLFLKIVLFHGFRRLLPPY